MELLCILLVFGSIVFLASWITDKGYPVYKLVDLVRSRFIRNSYCKDGYKIYISPSTIDKITVKKDKHLLLVAKESTTSWSFHYHKDVTREDKKTIKRMMKNLANNYKWE